MKKEGLTEQNKHQFIHRVQALQPNATQKWGSMTMNEMMFHCAKINNEILKSKPTQDKPTLKQRFIKIIALRILTQFPKGVKTGSKYLKTKDDKLSFSAEKDNLIRTIHQFADCKQPIYGKHPFFGALHTTEWRRFAYMHLDHHLRQFGV